MKNNINKEKAYKIIAMVLSVVMVLGSLLWIAEKGSSAAESNAEDTTETQEAIEKEYPDLLASHCQDGELSKEEVIYVAIDADGNIQDTSVTEWLHNGTGAKSINDVSTLNDIENTSNDKPFTRDGNSVVWEADGSDIKYKGTIDKELPVSVKVRYYLDGKSISAGDIAGKAGNVTIRFDYTINTEATSNGYVFKTPYTMASGVILDDEHFTDVKVNDGKVIDDGNKCICLGLAFPGLAENLDIHSTEFEIPETVMISAYTDRFEIDGTYTVAMTGMLSDIDFDGSDSLESKIEQLQDGMEKLGDASDKLVKGADQLTDGAYELAEGAGKISDGAASAAAGADQLASGLDKISDKSGELNGGAREVFNTLLSTAQTQIEATGLSVGSLTIGNYKDKLGQVIDSLDKDKVYEQALKQVTAEVEKNRDTIETGVTAAVKELVTTNVTAGVEDNVKDQVTAGVKVSVEAAVKEAVIKQAVNMSVEDYEAAASAGQISEEIRNQIEETIKQQTTAKMASDEIKAQIEVLVKEKMSSEEVKSQISQLIEQTMASDEISQQIANGTEAKIQELINEAMESEEVQNKLAEAEEGAKAVIALKTSLDKYNAFYLGVLAYTSAVDQASDGANKLSKGASELSNGAAQLSDGASDLYEGTSKLYDGMDTFDREGVRKLIASLDEAGVKDLFDRFSALADVSGRDSLIGGIADNMDGESRIIVKTGKIAANN
jgi:putative membrane protein